MELNAQQAATLHRAAELVEELQVELEDKLITLVNEFEERTHLKVIAIDVSRFDDDSAPCAIVLDARTRECR